MADGEDGLPQHVASTDDKRKRAWLFAAAGTAAAISAESGIAFVAHGQTEAAMLLISSSVIGLATIVAGE